MTDIHELPELVRHLRLEATFQQGRTTHKLLRTRRGSPRYEKWTRQKKIGHGGFGEVWLERKELYAQDTRAQRGPELRAVKCIHASLKQRDYARELEELATFSSNKDKYLEFFVQFYGWFQSEEWLHAIMEYCEYGDLRQYLQQHGKLPEAEVQDITRQILVGVSLMHGAGFAHRDIKPANVLIKKAPPDNWWVKLGDLGLSKRAEAASGSTTVRATPGFVPPEILGLFTGQDPKRADPFSADMWCLAETTFQALANRATFDTYGTLMQYVSGCAGFPIEFLTNEKVSDQGIEFIKYLMAPSPLDRPSSEQAMKHPWIVIEDDYKSDDGNFQFVEGACAVQNHDPQEDITQPDIHWTTDLDTTNAEAFSCNESGSEDITQPDLHWTTDLKTTNAEAFSCIESGSEEEDSENWSRSSGSSYQDEVTEIAPAVPVNPERRYIYNPERRWILFNVEPISLLEYINRWRWDVSKAVEESEDTESADEDEVDTSVYIHDRTMTRLGGHGVSAELLSRRVLSELACKYELSEKENIIIFHSDVNKEEIRDLVALSRLKRAAIPRSRSRPRGPLPRLEEGAIWHIKPRLHQVQVGYPRYDNRSPMTRPRGSETSVMAILGNRWGHQLFQVW